MVANAERHRHHLAEACSGVCIEPACDLLATVDDEIVNPIGAVSLGGVRVTGGAEHRNVKLEAVVRSDLLLR